MSEALTISAEPPDDPGLDYDVLRARGVEITQALSGDIWTDYNESNPGITTIEQLAYALTELSFRADIPVADFLTDAEGRIDPQHQALYPADEILPCRAMTCDDYRKLIIDRIPAVGNAWVTPASNDRIAGRYDIAIYAPSADVCVCPPQSDLDSESIKSATLDLMCANRNLCEGVRRIRILESVTTIVTADVVIDESSTPEEVLALILFRVGMVLSPEVSRTSLEEALLVGRRPPSEIFTGPRLKRGLIDDGELEPRVEAIGVQSIARAIAGAPGVMLSRNLAVKVDGESPTTTGDVRVPVDGILQLDPQPRGDAYSIRLTRNGSPVQPDPVIVQRRLEALWADQRRTYDLAAQYAEYLPFPTGRFRDLRRYFTIQNQYPMIYGINAYGVPSGAKPARKAVAKQFKGYLLVYDQLLADFFAQLSRVKDLFSVDLSLERTYFYQRLDHLVPDIDPLIIDPPIPSIPIATIPVIDSASDPAVAAPPATEIDDTAAGDTDVTTSTDPYSRYHEGLADLVRSQDPFLERRNRFLAYLLGLYSESLDAGQVAGASGADGPERLLDARLALLRNLVRSTRDRAGAFDPRSPEHRSNTSGMLVKSRIQLGMDPNSITLSEALGILDLTLVEPDQQANLGGSVGDHGENVDESFEPVEAADETVRSAALPGAALVARTVGADLLGAFEHGGEFRVGSLPGDLAVTLVFRGERSDEWLRVAQFPTAKDAADGAPVLVRELRRLGRCGRGLYIVEHNLIRFGRSGGHRADGGNGWGAPDPGGRETVEETTANFQPNFTITAVVSRHALPSRDERNVARDVVRGNTPSHVAVEMCFLGSWHMIEFDIIYQRWRRALRSGRPFPIARSSRRLRLFLERHTSHPPSGSGG